MIQGEWLATYSGLDEAEKAFRRLCEDGVDPRALRLEVIERCPACERRRAWEEGPALKVAVRWGQAIGGLLGLIGACYLMWGVGTAGQPSWQHVGLWKGPLGLSALICVLASYAMVGAMMGAMAAAAVSEARAPDEASSSHPHYALVLASEERKPPPGSVSEVDPGALGGAHQLALGIDQFEAIEGLGQRHRQDL